MGVLIADDYSGVFSERPDGGGIDLSRELVEVLLVDHPDGLICGRPIMCFEMVADENCDEQICEDQGYCDCWAGVDESCLDEEGKLPTSWIHFQLF